MTLFEIKSRLVAAHRSGDWDLAARLSQLKEKAKRHIRSFSHCDVCGKTVRGARGNQQATKRCKMHERYEPILTA